MITAQATNDGWLLPDGDVIPTCVRVKEVSWYFEDGDTLDETDVVLRVRKRRIHSSMRGDYDEFFV